MKKVDLSVIIPIYNAEKFLPTCLDSILNQTFRDFEIICVNDCSSDNTLKILEDYAQKDNRVKIINNKTNLGPGANRNIGINKAIGKYITFADADDFYLHNECFIKLIQKMVENDLDLLIFNNKEFDEKTLEFVPENEKRFIYHYDKKYANHLWNEEKIKERHFLISGFAWSKIYSRNLLIENQIYFPEGIYWEDLAFSNYVSLYCKRVYVLEEEFYAYRVNVSTSTTQNIMSKFDSIIAAHSEIMKFLKERNLYELCCVPFAIFSVASLCLYFLPQINDIQKAKELNSQIVDFISKLNLSSEKLKEIRKKNSKVANIINQYKKYGNKNIQEVATISLCGLPIIKYTNSIMDKTIYLFNICPMYKIHYKRANCIIHYLFNIIPWLKIKKNKAYLFALIPVIKFEKFKFYTENFEYELHKTRTRNKQ